MEQDTEKGNRWYQVLKIAREKHSMTQEHLAERIGVDARTVRAWEKGEQRPRLYAQRQLADFFNLSIEEMGLLGVEVKGEPNYAGKEGESEQSVNFVADKSTTTLIPPSEDDSARMLSIQETTSAESVRGLINLLITSGIRPEDARLKGYDSAFQLATDLIHLSPQEQRLPAHAILHSAMRIYRMAIEADN